MANRAHITAELCRQLIDYDPATGKMTWRQRDVSMFVDGVQPAAHNCAAWNARWVGKPAFYAENGKGHLNGQILHARFSAHQMAWLIAYGSLPEGVIDHINGNGRDNRLGNLRATSVSGNGKNAKLSRRNKSGCPGVDWKPEKGKWRVRASDQAGRNVHIGYFCDRDEAIAARRAAEARFDYHANHGRRA